MPSQLKKNLEFMFTVQAFPLSIDHA